MIVEYIRYELRQHAPEQLVEAYRHAGAHLQQAPECLGYDLARCDEDPGSMILRIRWVSAQAHMGGFRKGPNFPPFFRAIADFVNEIAEMRHYTPTDVAWRSDAADAAGTEGIAGSEPTR